MEGDLQRTLGQNVRAYREARSESQEQFAHFVGFHRTYISGLERGERNLKLKNVGKIAAKLDVEPLELLRP